MILTHAHLENITQTFFFFFFKYNLLNIIKFLDRCQEVENVNREREN